jgi:hypothetical protein
MINTEEKISSAELLLMINELRKRIEELESRTQKHTQVITSGSSPKSQAFYSAVKDGGK